LSGAASVLQPGLPEVGGVVRQVLADEGLPPLRRGEGGRGGEHLLLNVAVLVTQPEGNLPALGDHVHVEASGDLVAGDGQLSFPHGALLLSSPLLYRSRQPLSNDLRPGKICGIVVAYWRCARREAGKEAETDHVRGAKIFQ